jgi:hypothetical protein
MDMIHEVISLIYNNLIYFSVLLIDLVLIFFFLNLMEKGLKQQINSQLETAPKEAVYINQLKLVKESTQPLDVKLSLFRDISKSFFKYRFNLAENLDYSELREEFTKLGEKEGISFCSLILEAIYSEEQFTNEKMDIIMDRFANLILLMSRKETPIPLIEKEISIKNVNEGLINTKKEPTNLKLQKIIQKKRPERLIIPPKNTVKTYLKIEEDQLKKKFFDKVYYDLNKKIKYPISTSDDIIE